MDKYFELMEKIRAGGQEFMRKYGSEPNVVVIYPKTLYEACDCAQAANLFRSQERVVKGPVIQGLRVIECPHQEEGTVSVGVLQCP